MLEALSALSKNGPSTLILCLELLFEILPSVDGASASCHISMPPTPPQRSSLGQVHSGSAYFGLLIFELGGLKIALQLPQAVIQLPSIP